MFYTNPVSYDFLHCFRECISDRYAVKENIKKLAAIDEIGTETVYFFIQNDYNGVPPVIYL
jgi:hypothetical protein